MVQRIQSAADFGRVAVLLGGRSAEREISLSSGQAVLNALLSQGVDAHGVDVGVNISEQLTRGDFDRAFVVLHGRGGEDGEIQGLLQSIDMPFTGSDLLGAVLSMNKLITKQVWIQQGLPTPKFESVTVDSDPGLVIEKLGLPLIIKPVNEGSSIGMNKVEAIEELSAAIVDAAQFDDEILAESWIEGEEYTVGILGGKALPVIKLKTPNVFYDFDAKYKANTTEYLCPSGLSDAAEEACKTMALQAFNGVRMHGWGRIDFMKDNSGQFYLLEANSVPGMTDHSLVPMAAKAAGLSFETLVWQILESSFKESV